MEYSNTIELVKVVMSHNDSDSEVSAIAVVNELVTAFIETTEDFALLLSVIQEQVTENTYSTLKYTLSEDDE